MRHIAVTVGPQGSGKSMFCEKAIKAYPEIVLVSRDEILRELFGDTYLNPYTGQQLAGMAKMWGVLAKHLEHEKIRIILDCWNGYAEERRTITEWLRSHGADRIEAWYFVTPAEICVQWCFEKKLREKRLREHTVKNGKWAKLMEESMRSSCQYDYELYHSQPLELNQGFDFIQRIDPSKPFPMFSLFSK